MLGKILKILFGDRNKKLIQRYEKRVERINGYEEGLKRLSDEGLRGKTEEFRVRLRGGESLDDLLEEAFGVVREAAVRTLGMRHFDVQLIGGMALHEGKIAEMKTGEGKTLSATLSAYLNGIEGKGVHIVTVNDYLAKRDREWMGPIYEFLGLEVGLIQNEMGVKKRQEGYRKDITYGTNNEFGFDYLRDNMVQSEEQKVQREYEYAIVDEVDSILIDEARTPLIISGALEKSSYLHQTMDKIIPRLKKSEKDKEGKWIEESGDYQHEEKDRNVVLSEQGIRKVEKLLNVDNLYGAQNITLVHHINQALKAHILFKKDIDYIVEDNEVVIIDEHTGRKMHGRRYSDGLHQALEAKEKVNIEEETQTLASITFQNYFRLYRKLSGMTGTAETEAEEFYKIYKLDVVVIPTNRVMIREDHADRVYRTEKEKLKAILKEIKDCHRRGQPILVGTISIEKNEKLSKILKRENLRHNILNAKHHEMEAKVIEQAGEKGAITIATNMAGRGTDIKLGEGVKDLGGLHIIGTERHESRRIDNQLRGRSGRQGDGGSSRFYLSLEDDLMRLFGSDRLGGLMAKFGLEEGQELEHKWITRAIANAQKKVEVRNFEIRKHLLEYDDVMNLQRKYIYEFRNEVLKAEDLEVRILKMVKELVRNWIEEVIEEEGEFNVNVCGKVYEFLYEKRLGIKEGEGEGLRGILRGDRGGFNLDEKEFEKLLYQKIWEYYKNKREIFPNELVKSLETYTILNTIDMKWKEHLLNMDSIKEGIHLRAYGERNPLTEYKLEGSEMFAGMKIAIMEGSLEFLYKVEIREDTNDLLEEEVEIHSRRNSDLLKEQVMIKSKVEKKKKLGVKIRRNQQCPCGSGKKYKQCCGK